MVMRFVAHPTFNILKGKEYVLKEYSERWISSSLFWQWNLFIGFNELIERKSSSVPIEQGGMSSLDDRLAWVASNTPPDNPQYIERIQDGSGTEI